MITEFETAEADAQCRKQAQVQVEFQSSSLCDRLVYGGEGDPTDHNLW